MSRGWGGGVLVRRALGSEEVQGCGVRTPLTRREPPNTRFHFVVFFLFPPNSCKTLAARNQFSQPWRDETFLSFDNQRVLNAIAPTTQSQLQPPTCDIQNRQNTEPFFFHCAAVPNGESGPACDDNDNGDSNITLCVMRSAFSGAAKNENDKRKDASRVWLKSDAPPPR